MGILIGDKHAVELVVLQQKVSAERPILYKSWGCLLYHSLDTTAGLLSLLLGEGGGGLAEMRWWWV